MNQNLTVLITDIHADHADNARFFTDRGYDRRKGGKHTAPSTIGQLVASIKKNGLLENLVVRKHDDAEKAELGTAYRLVAGFRRFEALLKIDGEKGTTVIPVTVIGGTKMDAARVGLVENLHREDLTIAEKAVGLVMLREAMKEADPKGKYPSFEALGKEVHVSKAYANNLCNLKLKLDPRVWEDLENGHEKATVRRLSDDILTIDDHDAQYEKWMILSEQKASGGEGDGDGDGDEDDEGDGNEDDNDKPARARTRKAILEGIDALKAHKKDAGRHTRSADYYKGAMDWMRWTADKDADEPIAAAKFLAVEEDEAAE